MMKALEIKEKPILFSGPMVRANLNTKPNVWPAEPIDPSKPFKWQTRRLNNLEEINQEPDRWRFMGFHADRKGTLIAEFYDNNGRAREVKCPYEIGIRLWVRETWYYEQHMHDFTAGEPDLSSGRYSHRHIYRASNPDYPVNIGVGKQGWQPSIFMPKEAARIWMEVKGRRLERVREITEEDAKAEGVTPHPLPGRGFNNGHRNTFERLWDSLNAKRGYGWETNPWAWVMEFKRIEPGVSS